FRKDLMLAASAQGGRWPPEEKIACDRVRRTHRRERAPVSCPLFSARVPRRGWTSWLEAGSRRASEIGGRWKRRSVEKHGERHEGGPRGPFDRHGRRRRQIRQHGGRQRQPGGGGWGRGLG